MVQKGLRNLQRAVELDPRNLFTLQQIALSYQSVRRRSEERRIGKECRYRCDWSSDVCSSDLHGAKRSAQPAARGGAGSAQPFYSATDRAQLSIRKAQIGRASYRERV